MQREPLAQSVGGCSAPSLVKIGGMFIKITWEWCHTEEERADAFGASASDKTAGDTEPDAQQLKRVARI
jgi:hypothetical protein